MEIVTRKEALAKGLKHYFTGKLCKHGHRATRIVGNGTCVVCHRAYVAKSMAGRHKYNPDNSRRQRMRRQGVTLKEYDRMLAKQGGVCAICGEPPAKIRLAVDHCHTTGKVRGLLCLRCNMGLGYFTDDPAKLEAAIEYLKP